MSIQRRPGRPKPWRVRLRTPDGRELSRSFERKADAELWEAQQRAALGRGDWVDPHAGVVSFRRVAEGYVAGKAHRRRRTLSSYHDYLRRVDPLLGDLAVGAIRPATIREAQAELLGRLSPTTVRHTMGFVHAVLGQAVVDRLIVSNPADAVELPRVADTDMRVLDAGEVLDLADEAGRYRALVLTAAGTGLRWGEVAGLKVGRVDLLRRRLTVAETLERDGGRVVWGRPKSKQSARTISLPRSVADAIGEHLAAMGPGSEETVFSSPTGRLLRGDNFRRRVWKPAVGRSVGEPMRFHDLRHTHAATLIAQGAHPKAIQTRLGHASIRTTMDVYGHLMEGLDEGLAEGFDEALARAHVAQTRPKPVANL